MPLPVRPGQLSALATLFASPESTQCKHLLTLRGPLSGPRSLCLGLFLRCCSGGADTPMDWPSAASGGAAAGRLAELGSNCGIQWPVKAGWSC